MSKKDDLFNFGAEDLSAINAGFDRQIDALGATDRELAKARVYCIRGKFADALKIYESVVDEEVENVGGYIGIVRVHSKNFTVFDGAEIEKDIDIVRQIARGQNVKDEEYAEYLDARKKHFDKIAEDKKKKAEAEKLAKQKAAEDAKRKAAAEAEAKLKKVEEEKKKREETLKLYNAKEYDKAFPDILRFAEQGDSEFWFKAGWCYSNGKGVAQDQKKAVFWYEKSAAQGNKYAQYNLALLYFYGNGVTKDLNKAKELWSKAAAQGDADAKEKLDKYFSPEAIAKRKAEEEAAKEKKKKEETLKLYNADEYDKAFPDILRFAEQGDREFWFYAGWCYSNGKGVEQSKYLAEFWYEKAAAQGDKTAQNNLAVLYFYGDGVTKDLNKAKDLWSKAAAQGSAKAKENLDKYFSPEAIAKKKAEEEALAAAKKAKEREEAERIAKENAVKAAKEKLIAETSVPKIEGNTVVFGLYYQNSQTELEPLKWQILDEKVLSKTKTEKEVELFICTEKIIDAKPFIEGYPTPGKFYGSSIKKWLENEFMDTAFNDTAKKYIVNGYVENDEKTMYKSCPRYKKDYFGFNCPIYLLSYSELKKYFKNDRARIKEPTEYAKKQGLERNIYWTRSACDFYTGHHGFEGAKSSCSNISVCTESGDITKFAGNRYSNVISFEFENKINIIQEKTKFGVVCAMKIKVTLPR